MRTRIQSYYPLVWKFKPTIASFVIALLVITSAGAQSVENILWLSTVTGGSNTKTAQEPDGLAGTGGFSDALVRNYVKIFIDHGQNEYISGNPTYKVNITIRKYTDATTFTTMTPIDLTVTYSADNSAVYTDISEYSFTGFYKIRAAVNSVKNAAGTTLAYSSLPFSLGMAVGIEIDRYMDFDPEYIPPTFNISYDYDTYSDDYRNLIIKNFYIEGAYAYDIEWTYSNNYSNTDLGTSLASSSVEYWFKNNSTRIRVYSDDPVNIPATFDKGYVIARVRGIGKDPADLTRDVYGVWSLEDHYDEESFYKKHISDITDGDYYVVIGTAAEKPVHESDKNWMFQTTFAEEGKMKHTISYYDGTLRNRQTVTVVNTNEEAFITETFYDHQGRAAVQSIPGPAPLNLSSHLNKEIKYYENYNLADDLDAGTTNEKYGMAYFDLDDALGDPCSPYLTPFDITSGVAQYYSANNPRQGSLNGYIPDGGGYTYVLTEYTPDNTGRISRQSGVGPEHHLNTDHITQYFYAVPEQWELDRLFGNQIGMSSHYQKNAVVDPNGQVSVSYIDMRGNVIATALAGPIPENLVGLSDDGDVTTEYENSEITTTIDILDINIDNAHGALNELINGDKTYEVTKEILVTGESENTFSYTADDLDYEETCLDEKCLDCVYDIHISLMDKCGIELLNDGEGVDFTIGDVPLLDGSSTSLTCADYGYEWSEEITLGTGTYILTKTITLNEEAVNIYANLYIDYLQTENNPSCIKTLDDFTADLEDLSALSCDFSCEECQAITSVEEFVAAFPDIDFESYAEGTAEAMFEAFKSQCESLCPKQSNDYCDAGYQMMLADLRPNGQYAQYKDVATGLSTPDEFLLSVLNTGNILQSRNFIAPMPNLPNWQNPIIYFDDEWHLGYYDNDNNVARVEVEVIDLVAGEFDPPVVDDGLVFLVDGHYLSPPENLSDVNDFIAFYASHPEWARSLVAYHPEFYYYSYCSLGYNCIATIDGDEKNTYDFEAFLLSLPYDDPDIADYDGIQFLSDIAGTPIEAIENLVSMDPLFKTPTCYDFTGMPNTESYDVDAEEFENNLLEYDNCHIESPVTYYTIWEMINLLQNIGTVLGPLPGDCYEPTTSPDEVGTSVIDNEADWITFVNLYISAKQKYMNINAHMYALSAFDNATPSLDQNYYTGCIGNTEYDPYWEVDAIDFADFIELSSSNCLCNLYRTPMLADKQLRYPNLYTTYELSPGADDDEIEDVADNLISEGDYDYYYETGEGNMPLSIDVENLLNGLLLKTGWIDYDITDFDALEGISPRLYDFLTLPTPEGLGIDELLPTVSGAGDEIITWSDGGDVIEVTIDDDNDPINDYDWNYDDEKFVSWNNLKVTNSATGEFTIDLTVISPEGNVQTINLLGATAVKVDDDAFINDAISCDLTTEMNSIILLINYLKDPSVDEFEATVASPYTLSTDESSMVEYSLEKYLGPGPYVWMHQTALTGKPYLITSTDYTKYISIHFSTEFETSEYLSGIDPFGPDGYAGVVNSFIGMGVTGGYESPISGYVLWNNFYDDLEEPFIVGNCEYPINDPCNDEEVYNGIDLLGFLQAEVDDDNLTTDNAISALTEYTSRLKMLTGYDGTGTVTWNVTYAVDGKSLAAAFDLGGEDEYCSVTLNMDDPGIDFTLADLVSVDNLIADYTYATSDVAYYFTLDGHFTGGLTYTIHGFTSCIPLKNCFCGTIPAGFEPCDDYASLDMRVNDGTPFIKNAIEYMFGDNEPDVYPTTMNASVEVASVTWIIEACSGVYTIYNPNDLATPFYLLPMDYDATIITSFTCDYTDPYNPIAYVTLGEPVTPLDPLDPAGVPGAGTLEADCEPLSFEPFPPIENTSDCEGLIATLVDNAAQYAYDNYINGLKDQFIANYSSWCIDNLTETLERTYTSSEYHYTLYYYDQANNLAMTVPPNGVNVLSGTDLDNVVLYRNHTIVVPELPEHTYKTQYHYNSLNQLIWQETPDAGVSQFWYDQLGRMVLSQNQKQNKNYEDPEVPDLYEEKYSYIDFDDLGRIVEVGELYAIPDVESDVDFETNINTDAFPTGIAAYKYDVTHIFYNEAYAFGTSPFGTDGQGNLRNRIAYTTIEDFDDYDDDTYDYATHYSYDIHGNVKVLIQENPTLDAFGNDIRFKLLSYEYDLITGNVNMAHYQSGKEDQFHHKYYYDADNRLLAAFTSRDNHFWEKDARYFYYRHGPLGRTEIGDLKVQGIDYAYTIQGWLKGVNASALNTAKDMGKDAKYAGPLSSSNSYIGSDAFGFVLDYFKNDYTRINSSAPDFIAAQKSGGGTYYEYYDPSNSIAPDLWNGNIRGMSTALMKTDHSKVEVLGKSYQYDQLNRIKKSYSFIKASMDLTANFTWVGVSQSNYWNTKYEYDGNGNILKMKRSGNAGSSYDMDQLTYHYYPGTENSNRLQYVSDASTGSYSVDIDDQTGVAAGNLNYEYDEIGNLTKDVSGGISLIEWTAYHKISKVVKFDGTVLNFSYDPLGNRIMKKFDPPSGNTIYTYYLRDAQGNIMATYERVLTATTDKVYLTEQYIYGSSRMGYVSIHSQQTGSTPSSDYFHRSLGDKRYELTNHLNNVLAVITDRLYSYQEGAPYTHYVKYYAPDIAAAQDYDPFGMLLNGRNWSVSGENYRFGFDGYENTDEIIGDNSIIDFGARIYDSRIGRFFSIDPKSGDYPWQSDYAYFSNNPILFIDLNGQGGPTGYSVKSGDTPESIAAANGITVWDLANANQGTQEQGGLFSPTGGKTYKEYWVKGQGVEWKLNVGDVLVIPSAGNNNQNSNTVSSSTEGSNLENNSGESAENVFEFMDEVIMPPLEGTHVGVDISTKSMVNEYGWRGAKGQWYDNSILERQANGNFVKGKSFIEGSRNTAIAKVESVEVIGKVLFIAATAYNGTKFIYQLTDENYKAAGKTLIDQGMMTLMTYGGVPGLVIGGVYYVIDETIGWNTVINAAIKAEYQLYKYDIEHNLPTMYYPMMW